MKEVRRSDERAYLCVDEFIRDLAGARALHSALELGIVDELLQREACTRGQLRSRARLDERAAGLLLALLQANGVTQEEGGLVRLRSAFTSALAFRDLLEAKLDFADLVAGDVA